MKPTARKGSALLIVLGMLTFMVISAVAFAAYMRTARLPSSYLRRTVSSRLLAKAALAEAMERLDYAINDNPYPGVGRQRPTGSVPLNRATAMGLTAGEINSEHNYFYHHVFIGTNGWLTAEDTVSTLTLEGLAYIPPPLVNAARYYSRLTPTATWHWLGFDAGRYAYSVIDVSDCFDVNRLSADLPRNSASGRISLSYLFENSTHTGPDSQGIQPLQWDEFLSNYLGSDGLVDKTKVPLVSMADLALAMKEDNPFYTYLSSNRSALCNPGETTQFKRFMMMTDSYFPTPATNATDVLDLAKPEGQPFSAITKNANIDTVQYDQKDYLDALTSVGVMNLWDYLDEDSVPVSLGIPSVERVPMICTLSPMLAVQASLDEKLDSKTELDGGIIEYKKSYTLKLTGLEGSSLNVGLVYPFKRDNGANPPSFSLDGVACLFFSEAEAVNFRPNKVHPENGVFGSSSANYKDGVIRVPMASQSISLPSAKDEENALINRSLSLSAISDIPAFNVTYTVKVDPETGAERPNTKQYTDAQCLLFPVNADGSVNSSYQNKNNFIDKLKGEQEVKLHVAFYVRVTSGGKTVDMVPAAIGDDALNGSSPADAYAQVFGAFNPAMKFTTELNANFKYKDAKSTHQITSWAPLGVYCPDPRYNHAPENWIRQDNAITAADWLSTVKNEYLGKDGRANDIWMECSDQGYLQSIYELAMLPRLGNLKGGGDPAAGYLGTIGNKSDYGTGLGELVHGGLMWQTYRCFPSAGAARDDFENIGIANMGNSYKVNPYAQSLDSLMAAFANTPYNWSVASTNLSNAAQEMTAQAFNKKYAFSAMNGNAKFGWEDLEAVAEIFQEEAQAQAANGKTWEDAWDALAWAGTDKTLFGETLTQTDSLSDVDRKFLYGYWRDSFANKQQLFLIFVRAEPMMMGGGAIGQTPPQLGARAVALVWRDPEVGEAGRPHRMRVLFYRQFD